eukprot:COSAG01_NODE_49338_length_373_cov_0.671533_1_plen_20_part_01
MPRQRAEFFIATAMTGLWEA